MGKDQAGGSSHSSPLAPQPGYNPAQPLLNPHDSTHPVTPAPLQPHPEFRWNGAGRQAFNLTDLKPKGLQDTVSLLQLTPSCLNSVSTLDKLGKPGKLNTVLEN